GSTPTPIFTACDGATCTTSNRQPITTRPDAFSHPSGGVMVTFGTGSYFTVSDGVPSATPRIESVYGVLDKNITSTITKSQLLKQEIQYEYLKGTINTV